jgi:oligopeptide transport system permease protein
VAVLRRLRALALTLWAVHAAAFLLVRGARGGPFDGERDFPASVQAALRARYHLDEPLWQQYGRSLWSAIRGDFGPSMRYRDVSVNQILIDALPVSLSLGLGALILALCLGLPLGLWAASRRQRLADHLVLAGSTVLLSVPNFVLAGLTIGLFSFALGWLPPAGSGQLRHYLLPCLCLGLPFAAQLARLTRNAALNVLASDSIRTARAKGMPEKTVRRRHVLGQASVPILAFLGPTTAGLLTGSLVIEQVFALPGLGAHFVQAALNRDYTLALGITVTYTALLGSLTFLADVLMAKIDPRLESLT